MSDAEIRALERTALRTLDPEDAARLAAAQERAGVPRERWTTVRTIVARDRDHQKRGFMQARGARHAVRKFEGEDLPHRKCRTLCGNLVLGRPVAVDRSTDVYRSVPDCAACLRTVAWSKVLRRAFNRRTAQDEKVRDWVQYPQRAGTRHDLVVAILSAEPEAMHARR